MVIVVTAFITLHIRQVNVLSVYRRLSSLFDLLVRRPECVIAPEARCDAYQLDDWLSDLTDALLGMQPWSCPFSRLVIWTLRSCCWPVFRWSVSCLVYIRAEDMLGVIWRSLSSSLVKFACGHRTAVNWLARWGSAFNTTCSGFNWY